MIPMLAVVDIRQAEGVRLRLWLPLILLWILIAPLVIALAPFAVLIALACALNPFPWFAALWALLSATRGVRVDVQSPDALVFIHIL